MGDLIRISKGLKASFKNARDYTLSQALLEIEKYTDNYEVLGEVNRLYGDIDGKNIEGTEDQFNELNEKTKQVIIDFLKDEKYCLLTASSYLHRKISWRFVILNRKASVEDNKKWVQLNIENINLPTGITFDTAPYGKNQKMRMVKSNKDNEKRPLELVIGTIEDSLISYVPENCELMEFPKEKKTKKKVKVSDAIDGTLLERLIMNINNDENTDWEHWYKVAQAIFNENGNEELFLKWSSKSSKHNEKEALQLWKGLKNNKEDKLSLGSIYYWSNTSNPVEYENIILNTCSKDSYCYQKIMFEREHFKLMNPPCYVRIYNGTIQYIKSNELSLLYENKYCTEGLFINKWVIDPNIKTYEKVVFKPKQDVPSNVFNIFTDFPCEAVEGNIDIMNTLMMMLSGNNKEVFEYLENYFAHMIQKPYEKPGVCIIFYTQRQGAGKDTPLDFIGKILGNEYFFNTEDAENTVFGRFTSHLQKTILLKMEEVEFETNKKNESQLLSLITASTRSYEAKGKEAITLNDYKRIVMTTNKGVPVNIPESDRRFVLINSSEEKVGDREFWTMAYTELVKPEVARAYYYHLLTKDISQFDIRNRPLTDYYKEVKSSLRPYHSKFFQEQLETNPENELFKWRAWDLLTEMKSTLKFELTPIKFGKDIVVYTDAGIISKVHTRNGKTYQFNSSEMRQFLQSKGWLVEF